MTTCSSRMMVALAALVVVGFGVSSATAAIIDPDTITGTSLRTTWHNWVAADPDIWTNDVKDSGAFGDEYGQLIFEADLGSSKEIDALYVSYYGTPNYNRPNTLYLQINDTGVFGDLDWTTFDLSGWPTAGTVLLDQLAPIGGTGRYVGVIFAISYNSYITEVQFNEVSDDQIPEPATMALLGLGGLCVLRRRRRA